MRTTETVQFTNDQGQVVDYARVKDRLLELHNDNPECSISTEVFDHSAGFTLFRAEATTKKGYFSGHSLCRITAENVDQKLFEKHETIAVGRALAFAGYLATGEIASAEEMEVWKPEETPKEESVTTAQIGDLKVKWFAKFSDQCKGKDKGHIKTMFKDWVTEIVKEDIQDVDDFRQWSPENYKKCAEAL